MYWRMGFRKVTDNGTQVNTVRLLTQKLNIMQHEILDLIDRYWKSIPEGSVKFQPKKAFQEKTGYLPFEERVENKDW